MFTRSLQSVIENRLHQKKAIILIGARQVGKSTLFDNIVKQIQLPTLTLNCDEPETRQILTDINSKQLALLIGKNKVVVIDEAQRVDNIGMTLKLITDNFPDIQLLATGSSSFELRNRLNEPLTGRKYEYTLYPMSTEELMHDKGLLYVKQTLDSRLLYGSYPDVLNNPDNAKEILMNLASSYLYKDILEHEGIRRPELINKLLIALALQVGSEVSYNELAKTISTDNKTIERYIDMLEKCYVIFRLPAFSRNLRTELRKSKKIYFYDNGIRNAIIQNFAPLAMRQDVGALWE
ncbi:MAG: ATP-binding protein, partial [Muribaculaceae bacterium]|nr:ATP-binding protein [Muribaculaceae bacterium]